MPGETTRTRRPPPGRRSAPSLALTVQTMRRVRGRRALIRPEARVAALRGRERFA